LVALLLPTIATAGTKVHVISFGHPIAVQGFATTDSAPLPMKVRALVVDGRVKEYLLGAAHDITDRIFVVRRAFRVNDGLPEDAAPRWQWQLGGWLIVDRSSGRVSAANLPEFDTHLSSASWYRDYVAYCGVGDDGKKTYAVVAQLNRRRPVLRKALSIVVEDHPEPDSLCPAPTWQRGPVRVSFTPAAGEKQTFAIRGMAADLISSEDEEE
jgi:hypothetical protein